MWKDLDDDPEVQAKIASGELAHWRRRPAGRGRVGGSGTAGDPVRTRRPGDGSDASALTYTKEGRNSALVFLLGVVAIVIFGLFPDLRPVVRRSKARAGVRST